MVDLNLRDLMYELRSLHSTFCDLYLSSVNFNNFKRLFFCISIETKEKFLRKIQFKIISFLSILTFTIAISRQETLWTVNRNAQDLDNTIAIYSADLNRGLRVCCSQRNSKGTKFEFNLIVWISGNVFPQWRKRARYERAIQCGS